MKRKVTRESIDKMVRTYLRAHSMSKLHSVDIGEVKWYSEQILADLVIDCVTTLLPRMKEKLEQEAEAKFMILKKNLAEEEKKARDKIKKRYGRILKGEVEAGDVDQSLINIKPLSLKVLRRRFDIEKLDKFDLLDLFLQREEGLIQANKDMEDYIQSKINEGIRKLEFDLGDYKRRYSYWKDRHDKLSEKYNKQVELAGGELV